MLHECTLGKTIILWEGAVLYLRTTNPFGGDSKDQQKRVQSKAGAGEFDVAQKMHQLGAGVISDEMRTRNREGLSPIERLVLDDLLADERRGRN